ncbi:hypothetical protein G6F16_001237 [Rhizopus arrhizus]|nr:hypothetical protein G6F21_001093 [Rhizopus arrhizus]KAG0859833.1 hypothetical protein G6F17_001567 [Rhizopus arrhizus]KAG0877951.1 hypothetical protein G6F16_001237 [Rhizopus arrhizus]KAG0902747.1 hypothetical protein G6F34_001763 [Rhizopus arrhizus]KAG1044551.1 hypothetical protein G6F25_001534 [Rhizopus arrhizus]
MGLLDVVPTGVLTGDNVRKLLNYAHENKFAIPAINCTSTSTVNAALEAAKKNQSPIIIQFSNGGSAFFAGKAIDNKNQEASILGAVAGAQYVRAVAKAYGVPVLVHSDHCAKKLLPWFDGMLDADEKYFKAHGEPLFSSHMLDLSEEPVEENIETCLKYLQRMAPMGCLLEMEIGITGGEEDGVDNTSVDNASLYTQPEDIWEIYSRFSKVTDLFSIAAAFGNVHGVYAPGNVKLHPELLGKHQAYVQEKLKTDDDKPVYFVFHGGSGSSRQEIDTALKNGVVKMNVDTDTQWAYWKGLKDFYEKNKDYLQSQVGNPEGPNKPNKKYYDPRVFIRASEQAMIDRIVDALDWLNNKNVFDVPVSRPLMRLRMGSQQYFSSRSKHANGNWNEGFLFTISFHNQLFDIIELDLYDKRKKWRSKLKHIGKAKLKIAQLKNRNQVFITFLPMYEYHVKRYLPAHIQLPHTFLKSHIPNMSMPKLKQYYNNKKAAHQQGDEEVEDLFDLPPYQLHPSHSKHSMTPFIGSIQVRVRYSFQLDDNNNCETQSPLQNISMGTLLSNKSKQISRAYTTDASSNSSGSDSTFTNSYHDAIEPNLVFVDNIQKQSQIQPQSDSTVDLMFHNNLDLQQTNVDFPKMDGENKKKEEAEVSDTASIKSHNFGDKNFAFKWINESFEEVALSHPSLDRMIGLVVSPQTRTLLRAVVKIFNAFGQGFKITILQLLSSLSLLQNFYAEIPREPLAEKITDLKFLDEAHYFLGHAIIAYGWRGISYLGDYAKYMKDVVKTKSNKEAIVRYLKIPQEDLLGYEYGLRKGAVFQPSYFVSYDQVHEAVVLGIRGTWSLYDCITDLVCEYRPWKGGLVHSGLLASAQWFFTNIIPQIFLYIGKQKARRISSFVITGHSLGAGTSAILTMMVVDYLDQLRELSDNPGFKVQCFCYAPVASLSLDLCEKYKEYISSFVCHDDLVARLSYGTASCAKELIMDSVIATDGLGGSSKVNSNPRIRKECFDIIQARRKEIYHGKEPRYPLLYVPGRVYQFRRQPKPKPHLKKFSTQPLSGIPLRRKKSFMSSSSEPNLNIPKNEEIACSFTLHHSSSMLSEEVYISKTCLEDHMVATYLNAFQAVRQDCMRQDAARKKNNSETCSFHSSSSTLKQSSPSSSKIKLNDTKASPFIQSEKEIKATQ